MTTPSSSASNVLLIPGDLFAAPANSVLIRACNALGSWRSGVALAFRSHYPQAHTVYVSHCARRSSNPSDLSGTALLIPPQPGDTVKGPHWVACLFTSVGYGRSVDPPEVVVRNTEAALRDLEAQVAALEAGEVEGGMVPGEWHAAKINSVRFKVPWERTAALLEGVGRRMVVYEFDEAAAR
ncbi:hypothetical protein EDC01DRAFT_655817 [Geopyxis carbonaria]|nr:hypothetical protein EDC01DRAFT_655817 [Geopyxis carbonaria]